MKIYKLMTHLMLLGTCLAGCATTDDHPSEKTSQPDMTTLSLEHATDLVVNHKAAFQSAYLLASQRPAVKQEITEFGFGITSDDQEGEIDSVARFYRLPGGLEYSKHAHTDLVEATIGVFGVTSISYWNGRFPFPFVFDPHQVSLTNGGLFSVDSGFTLETKYSSQQLVETCQLLEDIPANSIHRKLNGRAAVFQCTAAPLDVKYKLWYLADYARYVNFEIYAEDHLQAAIRIKDVKFK